MDEGLLVGKMVKQPTLGYTRIARDGAKGTSMTDSPAEVGGTQLGRLSDRGDCNWFDILRCHLLRHSMEAGRPRMRRDAEANREKLVLAAKRLMQDQGGDVAVEVICELAGITRGTFYRNFPDRAALYEAVLEHELEDMIAALEVPAADPLTFLRLFAEMMMVYDKFLTVLPDMDDWSTNRASEAKIIAAIAPALGRAQANGIIASDITGEDIMILCRMISADWRLDPVGSKEEALDRRLGLLLRGISPRASE
ncbi:TetR/AcrR family transcriptional regulator [Sphingomonas faeni]|nr:TetR/AcrR family transcriptional regulator [Sphingomonas faeni]